MGLFTGREVPNPKPRSCTLMDAVRDDDRELVSKTLEAGEDVRQTNAYLRTPLHKAAYYSGHPEVIESLIRRGADVNARDKGNWTALHLATRNGHLEAVRLLLDAGSELTVQDSKHGWTALHLAVITGKDGGSGELGGRAGLGGRGAARGEKTNRVRGGGRFLFSSPAAHSSFQVDSHDISRRTLQCQARRLMKRMRPPSVPYVQARWRRPSCWSGPGLERRAWR